MTTKVKSDRGWKITCFDGSYVVYFNNFSVFENHPTLEKAMLSENLKSELRLNLSNGLEIDIPEPLSTILATVVKDDTWRIAKILLPYATVGFCVQTRVKDTTPWNSPTVKATAVFDNLEAAMLKVIELLEAKNG